MWWAYVVAVVLGFVVCVAGFVIDDEHARKLGATTAFFALWLGALDWAGFW